MCYLIITSCVDMTWCVCDVVLLRKECWSTDMFLHIAACAHIGAATGPFGGRFKSTGRWLWEWLSHCLHGNDGTVSLYYPTPTTTGHCQLTLLSCFQATTNKPVAHCFFFLATSLLGWEKWLCRWNWAHQGTEWPGHFECKESQWRRAWVWQSEAHW